MAAAGFPWTDCNLMTFASKTHRVAMPALLPRLRRHLPGVLAVVAGSALALSPRAVDAQRQSPPQVTTIDSVLSDGSVKAVPIPTKRGFDLFASEDIAGGTLRMTGGFRTGVVNQAVLRRTIRTRRSSVTT